MAEGQRNATFETSGIQLDSLGIHHSRTMMLRELSALLDRSGSCLRAEDYRTRTLDDNVLSKRTLSARSRTFGFLRRLYTLDNRVVSFWFMQHLWNIDRTSVPLIACALSQARDSLFRQSHRFISEMEIGERLIRTSLEDFLADATSQRYSYKQVRSLAQNIASSWQQSGHLTGKINKYRQTVTPTVTSVAYALFLSYLSGLEGESLFRSHWIALLDASDNTLVELASEAGQLGLLEYRRSGNVIDISFNSMITLWATEAEREPN